MTHAMTVLILQLALIVISARVLGFVFAEYLKQPKVLGELAAGMLIGPYALGSLHFPGLHQPLFPLPDTALPVSPELYGFAAFASIVLLFLAGLETDLPTFLKFSVKGSMVGLGGVVVSFALGDAAAVLLLPKVTTFMHPEALFLGTLSTATSVGITARILSEKRKMSSPEGVTILAAAVLDDVLGIVLLAVVVGIAKVTAGGAGGETDIAWGHIGLIALKAFGFWLGCTVIGILVAPKLTKGLKRFKSMPSIAALAFGIALLLAGLSEMVGLAMIIGAYVTGLALSRTDIAHELREGLQGVYEFMVPIFFCIMGMMVDFSAIAAVFGFGLAYTVFALAGKIFGCGIPALLAGFNLRGALRIGAGMLPRGEVTLIIAGVGLSAGIIGPDMFGVAVMTLLVASVIAPPYLIATFKGGSGYVADIAAGTVESETHSIDLEFPSTRMAAFIRGEVLRAFQDAEFFVQHIDLNRPFYHVRKDEILISVRQEDTRISVSADRRHEEFVRLLMLETILDLKDFLQGLQSMKSPDMMGAELLMGLFAEEDQSDSKSDTSK